MTPVFDGNQRRAITVRGNAVVTAGAGSGKTAVLVERFLWLLESRGAGVDQILALTFTQKAAAEMYERIYTRLRGAGAPFQEALEGFERSQISTLDSFCAEIVRGSAGRYGLAAEFRYDEETVLQLARDVAMDFLLENLEHPAVRELIRVQGFETVWLDLLSDLAFRHLHFAPRPDFAAMVEAQLERCRQDLAARLDELDGLARRFLAIEPRTATLRAGHEAARSCLGVRGLVSQERYGEAETLLGTVSLRRSGSASPDLVEMSGLIEALRPLVEETRVVAHTLEQRTLLREVSALLGRFRESFVEAKRLEGLATFQDVAELAVDILLQDRPLRQYYKERFRHILIDEFQDNNRLQRDLLFLLAERPDRCAAGIPAAEELEEDKLFFVGDEKQSIYRFRGADVRVFKSLHRELERAGGCVLELDRNYRSEAGLVAFFNRLFERVLAPAAEPAESARPFEARFQRMLAGAGDGDGTVAQVHLLLKPPSEEGGEELAGDREAEAHAVAAFIHRAVDRAELMVGKPGDRRPARYEDFAVLLRSTGNQIHFERMFRSFRIPYTTPNLRSLFLEAPINDFYLLLQLAIYPEDRSAYAGFLRSPFVNLSDETLVRLLLEAPAPRGEAPAPRGEAPAPPPFWVEGVAPGEAEKLRRAAEVYEFVREHADRLALAKLVHQLWYRFGYRHLVLSDPRYHPYLEFYEYLVAIAEAADRRGETLARFLDFLRPNLGRFERLEELETLEPKSDGVQLLTIHKSKGLEFPVVVLADMGNAGRRRGSAGAYYRSDEFGFAVNLGRDSHITRLGEAEAAEQELAEIRRLLYVACTRAMNHLVLSGSLGRRADPLARAHLTLLLQALEVPDTLAAAPVQQEGYRLELHRIEDLPRGSISPPAVESRTLPLSALQALYDRQPLERAAPRRDISVTELCSRLTPPTAGADGEDPAGERLPGLPVDSLLRASQLEDAFGTLTHELLAAALQDPEAPARRPDWGRLHIPAELRSACLESAETLVSGFLASELGRTAREAETIETELAFVYRCEVEGRPLYVSGQIDAVLHTPQGLLLIDFKTDRVHRPGQHDCQISFYALALQELTGRDALPYLFLLRGARAVPLERRLDWPSLLASLRL